MTKKAFDKIAGGLKEAIAIARGEAKPARLHSLHISTYGPNTEMMAYSLCAHQPIILSWINDVGAVWASYVVLPR